MVEACLVAAGALLATEALQREGCLQPFLHAARASELGSAARTACWWTWPALAAAAAHLALGPKQRRPIYVRSPGALYVYAGVRVDRGGGCRGGLVTGATGAGKTLCCILPRLHSICVHEPGVERPSWPSDPLAARLRELRRQWASGRGAGDAEPSGLHALRQAADACRTRRFAVPPWGGLVFGEKGGEWRTLVALLGHYGRPEDACILQVRPDPESQTWKPSLRLNLLAMDSVPADTYAQMIVDTALACEEAASRDEFFVPQARDKIAWGLRLLRACGAGAPTLASLAELLASEQAYARTVASAQPRGADAAAFEEARYQLETNFWSQPPEQLGGVRSTIQNFLSPYLEPEIAEVFCSDSTVDLRDMEAGKVFCLAIPQRYSVQRRYVATLMKALAYRIVLERFDRPAGGGAWTEHNVVLIEQDEWQRNAVRADCDVDVVREARGAVYAATQSQDAVWLKLGGREKAAPLIANLRNRWICQAATQACAQESSDLLSERSVPEVTRSSGDAGRSTSVSVRPQPVVGRSELRALRPFHVLFAPAEGPWLYRRCIAMPATPDGRIPDWWFGDWNPLHWVTGGRKPGRPPPPWRAAAPLRAQVRWLLGLDGTFIITGGRRAWDSCE